MLRKHILPACVALLLCLTACSGTSAETPADDPAEQTASAEQTEAPAEETTAAAGLETEQVTDTGHTDYPVTDPFSYEVGTPVVSGDLDTVKEVNFFRDGKKIYGKLYLPEGKGPFPTVVICSGQTAAYTYYTDEAEEFAENGYAALIFDFTGAVGRSNSDGELTENSMLTEAADLNVILDSLSQLPKVDTGKVFLWGHSLGGLVATYIGCCRPDDIQGMILIEPSYRYPDEVREVVASEANGDFAQIPDQVTLTDMRAIVGRIFFTDMYSVDIFEKMPDCTKDVLIFLGTVDCLGTNYPDYFERAEQTFPSAEVVTVEGADHFFQGEHGETAMQQALAFIKERI